MAGDSRIVYNFSTISGAVDAIDVAIGNMRGTLEQLQTDLHPLETDAWTSEAQAAYRQRKERWNTAANDIVRILGAVKGALVTSAERMQHTDRMAAARLNG